MKALRDFFKSAHRGSCRGDACSIFSFPLVSVATNAGDTISLTEPNSPSVPINRPPSARTAQTFEPDGFRVLYIRCFDCNLCGCGFLQEPEMERRGSRDRTYQCHHYVGHSRKHGWKLR